MYASPFTPLFSHYVLSISCASLHQPKHSSKRPIIHVINQHLTVLPDEPSWNNFADIWIAFFLCFYPPCGCNQAKPTSSKDVTYFCAEFTVIGPLSMISDDHTHPVQMKKISRELDEKTAVECN